MHRSEAYSSISFYICIPQCNHYPDQDLEHSVTSECLLWSSLEVQWLVLYASTAGDEGSVPGQGTKILHAMLCGKKREREKEKTKKWVPLCIPVNHYPTEVMAILPSVIKG